MNRLIPSETALVLGGGGAKGAYETGVIAALRELGIRAGSVYGTSIGALNAAMYAQGAFDEAEALWETLRLSDLITPESMRLADDAEAIFDHPEKMIEFITRYAQHKGMDISPLRALIRDAVDEEKLRKSPVRFGLVATKFPSMTMVEKRLADMEPGSLHDWLLASCACFPVFPMARIGEERYIDGGFLDNVPVAMAIKSGAQHIIAVDIGKNPSHLHYTRRPNVTYIRASHPLGGLLTFDPAQSRRNRTLGYNDALRAFGRLRGTQYAFDPIDAVTLRERAQRFVARLSQLELSLFGSENKTPLFDAILNEMAPGGDAVDCFLRCLELCALAAQVNPAQVFTFDAFVDELRARLPLDKAESMLDNLPGGRIGVLFSAPQPEPSLVIACLFHLLQREGAFSPLALRTLVNYPKEMLCAYTLKEVL